MSEEQEQVQPAVEDVQVEEVKPTETSPLSYEDGVIKVDLGELNKSKEEVEQVAKPIQSESVIEEAVEAEEEQPVLQEITDEEIAETAEDLEEDIQEAIEEQQISGAKLPENIQKVVEFMNDTGGSLEDYVKLNTDYDSLDEDQLLKEYYKSTKPHLEDGDIDFLMEDTFSYDEDIDEEREIRRKKIQRSEALSEAKKHLDTVKSKYYEEIKGGANLAPEQKKAIDFFNRYNKENEENTKVAKKQHSTFLNETNTVFNKDFKGFDYSVGDKKYRFNVKDAEGVKSAQSDINNFVKKFLNEDNEMSNAKGYHKSLFTAMNPDAVAKHFYEQGKADAIKDSMARTKNVDMDPRGSHEKVTASNGWSVKSVNGVDSSRLKIKINK